MHVELSLSRSRILLHRTRLVVWSSWAAGHAAREGVSAFSDPRPRHAMTRVRLDPHGWLTRHRVRSQGFFPVDAFDASIVSDLISVLRFKPDTTLVGWFQVTTLRYALPSAVRNELSAGFGKGKVRRTRAGGTALRCDLQGATIRNSLRRSCNASVSIVAIVVPPMPALVHTIRDGSGLVQMRSARRCKSCSEPST